MKQLILAFSILAITISFTSCLEDSCEETRTFTQYEAIFAHPDDFRIEPTFSGRRALENPGKIYYYNNLIMINEKNEGIHIYDNTTPASPSYKGFINIPGNVDVSIKNDIMYADSYVDLLTIDVRNLEDPVMLCRDEDVFDVYGWQGDRGYYIGLDAIINTVEVECSEPNYGDQTFWRGGNIFIAEDANAGGPVPAGGNGGFGGGIEQTGVGGSFARFSVIANNLYVINATELVAYDIQDATKPRRTQTTRVSWGQIETLFPYKNYLFIGGNSGMYIYDRTNPNAPTYVSEFQHARACDPVFVKDDVAYVTLRNGTICEGFVNQLDVIDVSNIENPTLIATHEMDNPHGLAISNNELYLCEGEFGLKVFENEKLEEIGDNRIEHIKDIHAYDAIALSPTHLFVIGNDGLYQYDSSDPSDLDLISFLEVKKQ